MRYIIASLSHRAKVSQAIKRATLVASLAALAGCTFSSGQTAAVTTAGTAAVGAASTMVSASTATKGQLFCSKATADGPLVVALVNAAATAAGQPEAVVVTGLASSAVAAACAAWDSAAVPVVPPTTAVPTVAVVVPAAS